MISVRGVLGVVSLNDTTNPGGRIMHVISKRIALVACCAVIAAAALQSMTDAATAQSQPAKRVYIVQSYEKGHVCGEPQAEGILDALATGGWEVGRNLTVQSYYMDTYRTNAAPEAMKAEGQKALAEIAQFKPDIVFVLDDAAVRQVMLPLIGRADLSIVFSGMNGQPEIYNDPTHYLDSRAHPGGNVTGVYEKLYAAQSLKVMAQAVPALRSGKAVMITDGSPTGNGLTRQFELELKDSDIAWEVRRVKDWGEYTALIQTLNDDATVKAIYPVALTLPVEGGGRYAAAQIYDWTITNSRKPEMAINYFFARMGLFGGAVINFNSMGKLAGQKGAKILGGTKAGDLPVEDAPDYAIVFNLKRAGDLGIEISPRVLAAANAIYRDNLVPLQGRPLLYDPQVKSF
jgi:putative ABC transport system substrate-binding protein